MTHSLLTIQVVSGQIDETGLEFLLFNVYGEVTSSYTSCCTSDQGLYRLLQKCQASLPKGRGCSKLMYHLSSLIVNSTVQGITHNTTILHLFAAAAIAVQTDTYKLHILTLQTARASCQDCCCQLWVQLTLVTQWLSSVRKPITHLQ